MMLTTKEACEAYRNVSVKKATMPVGKLLGKSFLAGMMIALGATTSSVAAHAITNVGVARLVAGCVFPVGLMMVLLLNAELFTGDCLMAMAVTDKKISLLQFIRTLVLVFIGNFVGGLFVSGLVYACGQLDYSNGLLGAYTIKVALGKATLTPVKGISSGILCNILVAGAVLMALCAKDVAGKLLTSFFVIMPFVTGGFEHCVANMYYISAGIFAKMNPAYVQAAMDNYGIDQAKLDSLNFGTMIVNNLIPVTIGNIIGGSLVVGLAVYLLNKE